MAMTFCIIFKILTLLYNICISSLFVNTELHKCVYLFAKQLSISELVEYPSIDCYPSGSPSNFRNLFP